MQCFILVTIALAMPLQAAAQASRPSPSARFESLLKEYNESLARAQTAHRAAKTDAERKQALALFPTVDGYGPRFLAIAREHPGTSAACDSQVWIVAECRRAADEFPTRVGFICEAMETLVRDHVDDPRVGHVCRDLTRATSPLREKFLRSVYERTTNREVRGFACLSLAQYLATKVNTVQKVRNIEPGKRGDFLKFASDAHFEALRQCDPDVLTAEAGSLFERTISEFGDLRTARGRMTLGEVAEANLKALRRIAIGKPAPDIEGADVEGAVFRLNDYRGKVVLLSFSGSWCAPCRELYPHRRDLVARLKDKPFVLLGVNTDNKETLRKAIGSGDVTWKCWWDGGLLGPICKDWHVYGYPTEFVIDAQGVIRHRNVRGAELERVLDQLVAEVAGSPRN